jgi:alpha-beta hydrolase superfamily lysophospholipase
VRAAVLLVLAACASAPDRAVEPDLRPPAGSTAEVITMADGAELVARHWASIDAAPRAVVVIVHDRGADSTRHAALAARLAAAGYSVYAYDLRGHGRSSGPRGGPDDRKFHVADLDRYVAAIATREPGRPILAIGYGFGAKLAAAAHGVDAALTDPTTEAEILAWLAAQQPA